MSLQCGLVSWLDSIAVSVFADIFIELTNTVSDGKIQIIILILRRGALSTLNQQSAADTQLAQAQSGTAVSKESFDDG